MNSSRMALMWFMASFTGALLAAGFVGHTDGVVAKDAPRPETLPTQSATQVRLLAWDVQFADEMDEFQTEPHVMTSVPGIYLDPRQPGPLDNWRTAPATQIYRVEPAARQPITTKTVATVSAAESVRRLLAQVTAFTMSVNAYANQVHAYSLQFDAYTTTVYAAIRAANVKTVEKPVAGKAVFSSSSRTDDVALDKPQPTKPTKVTPASQSSQVTRSSTPARRASWSRTTRRSGRVYVFRFRR